MTAISLNRAETPAPSHTQKANAHRARNMPEMAPRALFAPAAVPAMVTPLAGPIAVADILKLAGGPAVVTPVSAAAAPIGGACDLTDPVQSALRANPDVGAQLPMIPADQRTVANAIMVWNAGWLHSNDAAAKGAYAAIRDTVAAAVLAAPDACRSQVQSGPRLVFLPGSRNRTTVLAIGSGQWTWQQVADTAFVAAVPAMAGPTQFTAASPAFVPHASLKTGEE